MFRKASLVALAAVTALTGLPAAVEARDRSRSYVRYSQPYYGGYGYAPQAYHDRSYYARDRYRGRCRDRGTTGTILGAIAGGLIGREIDKGGGNRRYYRRDNGTTGLIVGGAAGALIGRSIDRNC